jgi:hypothetical protein
LPLLGGGPAHTPKITPFFETGPARIRGAIIFQIQGIDRNPLRRCRQKRKACRAAESAQTQHATIFDAISFSKVLIFLVEVFSPFPKANGINPSVVKESVRLPANNRS